MANRFRTRELVLSGQLITANSSSLFVNGSQIQGGGGVTSISGGITGVSITGGISMSGSVNVNAGNNITLTQAGLHSFTIAAVTGGVPIGGTSGQYLRKYSANAGEYRWDSTLAGGTYSGITVTSFVPNANLGNVINLVLTGNITLAAPTGYTSDGQTLTFRFRQLPTGDLISWNSIYDFGTDITSSMLPTGTTNAKYEVGCRFFESEAKWRIVGLARGF